MKFLPYLIFSCLAAGLLPASADEFRPLFNGSDLTGWEGSPELWSVHDGTITGKTTGPGQLKYNQFLIWRGGVVKNFELHVKVKQSGNNTGIQYRSRELPAVGPFSVGGYQCDIHPNAPYNAMLYEERGRGIVAKNGQNVVADPQHAAWLVSEHEPVKADVAQWNEYTIIAQGNHVTHKLNGQVTADFVDHDATARSLEGVLAFQIHAGPAMEVQIKDVLLKELPEGGGVDFATTPIPSDAQRIEGIGPAKPKPAP
ncbi:MAG: heme-binding protein, partial [Verrucomicrobiales bacterium]|nr:heme-binding protein [Verrucomicrobiales bacterium]